MHDARTDHAAVALADGRVFVIGGYFNPEDSSAGESVTSAEIYDPGTNAWTIVDNVPDRVFWSSATLLHDGRVFVVGATDRAYPHEQRASIYDPASDEWATVADTELVRGGNSVLVLADGKVLVAGGWEPNGEEPSPRSDAALYDPATNRWADVGPMADPGFLMPLALLPDDRAIALWEPNQLFDPAKRTWTLEDGPASWAASEVVELLDGRLLAFPTENLSASAGDIYLYKPQTAAWSSAGRFIQISNMSITRLLDGRVLSAGGYLGCDHENPCATGDIASAWVFDPAGVP